MSAEYPGRHDGPIYCPAWFSDPLSRYASDPCGAPHGHDGEHRHTWFA